MATVTIQRVTPRGTPIVVEYAGPSQRTGGLGGWQEIARPRRAAATEWTGLSGRLLTVPILVNSIGAFTGTAGRLNDVSVEALCRRVEGLGLPAEQTGEPQIFRLEGPVLHRGLLYVLDDIEEGAYELNSDGERVAAQFTLICRRYEDADVLVSPARRGKSKPPKAKTTTVLKADLAQGLAAVSVRKYGTTAKAEAIRELNGIRDPKNIRVGQVLKLP